MNTDSDMAAAVVVNFPTPPKRDEGLTLRQCIDAYMAAYTGRDNSRVGYLSMWVSGPSSRGPGTCGAQRPDPCLGARPFRSGNARAAAAVSRAARSRDRERARLVDFHER
jgi:hypothetical protein